MTDSSSNDISERKKSAEDEHEEDLHSAMMKVGEACKIASTKNGNDDNECS